MVDVGIGPAGDVWVTNNWQNYLDAWARSMKHYKPKVPGREWWSSMEWRSR